MKQSSSLSRVVDADTAATGQLGLQAWRRRQGHLTKQRSTDERTRWWTHDKVRNAWLLPSRLSGDGHLFRFVMHSNARSTSLGEGGVNNDTRTTWRNHRGMRESHMKRAAEWLLCKRALTTEHAYTLIL